MFFFTPMESEHRQFLGERRAHVKHDESYGEKRWKKLRSFIFRLVWHESKILQLTEKKTVCTKEKLKCVYFPSPRVWWRCIHVVLSSTSIPPYWILYIINGEVSGRRRWMMMRILTDLCGRCLTHKFHSRLFSSIRFFFLARVSSSQRIENTCFDLSDDDNDDAMMVTNNR